MNSFANVVAHFARVATSGRVRPTLPKRRDNATWANVWPQKSNGSFGRKQFPHSPRGNSGPLGQTLFSPETCPVLGRNSMIC